MPLARDLLIVTLLCLASYLPGAASIPFYGRGEAREALVARGVAEGRGTLVPMRANGVLTRKPPLYYWEGSVALRLAPGRPERALRLPSIVGGTVGVLATYATTRLVFGHPAALPAALVLATSFEWLRASTRARVDMALAAPLALLLLAWIGMLRGLPGAPAVATVALTLAVLAKGPVALVLGGATAAAFWILHRREVRLGAFIGPLVVAALLSGTWYAAAYALHGAPFAEIVAQENWGRFLDTESASTGHAHGAPYLLALGLVGVLPWTPLLPLALRAPAPARRAEATLLALWLVIVVVFFSLATSKRSVYLLPALPALAAFLAAGLSGDDDSRSARIAAAMAALDRPVLWLVAASMSLYLVGIDPGRLVVPLLTVHDAGLVATVGDAARSAAWFVGALALVSVVAGQLVERARRARRWRRLVIVLSTYLVVLTAVFQTTLHPAMAEARSMREFMTRLDRYVPEAVPVYMIAPVDGGVRFYAPRPVRVWPGPGPEADAFLLMWERALDRWVDAAGAPLVPIATSTAAEGRRGALVLVRVPAGGLHRPPEWRPQNG